MILFLLFYDFCNVNCFRLLNSEIGNDLGKKKIQLLVYEKFSSP